MKPHSKKQQTRQHLPPDYDFCDYRLRTARQKRRLVIEDRDKQLLALGNERTKLYRQIRNLPDEPLNPPIQRGWQRFFVLRDDVARSAKAAFYESILRHINTTQRHHDRRFVKRKRKFGRKYYVPREQHLARLDEWEWRNAAFTPAEAALFEVRGETNPPGRGVRVQRVFTEPWRFRLQVAPFMVTHRRVKDSELEARLAAVRRVLDNADISGRLDKLTRGNVYGWWKSWKGISPPDIRDPFPKRRPFRNWPVHLLAVQEEW